MNFFEHLIYFYCIIFYTFFFIILAPNVLGNLRFDSPNKSMCSKTRAGKMWVS